MIEQSVSSFAERRKKRKRLLLWIGALVFCVVGIPLMWFIYSTVGFYSAIKSGTAVDYKELRQKSSIAKVVANANVTADDLKALEPVGLAPELGNRSARVTMVEFLDYQCPYSAAEAPVIRKVMASYADRVHFLVRDYPLADPNGRSRIIALAANCVLEQGQETYWRFHDRLYSDQVKNSDTDLRDLATASFVNLEAYDACIKEGRYNLKIDKDIEVGQKAGVEGTPSVFVNGAKFQGELDEVALTRILDYVLAELPQ